MISVRPVRVFGLNSTLSSDTNTPSPLVLVVQWFPAELVVVGVDGQPLIKLTQVLVPPTPFRASSTTTIVQSFVFELSNSLPELPRTICDRPSTVLGLFSCCAHLDVILKVVRVSSLLAHRTSLLDELFEVTELLDGQDGIVDQVLEISGIHHVRDEPRSLTVPLNELLECPVDEV